MKGGDAEENALLTRNILAGELRGPKLDIVLANAGAALFVAERSPSLREGVELARELVDSGSALGRLNALIETTGKYS